MTLYKNTGSFRQNHILSINSYAPKRSVNMKLSTFEELLEEYRSFEDDPGLDDIRSVRSEMIAVLPHSLIVEGSFLEWDNLERWLDRQFGPENGSVWKSVFYGKTGYDYGYWEFFFSSTIDLELLIKTIPTIYGQANGQGRFRSEGYDCLIDLPEESSD